jgi:DNA helicase-2/ATP-dependent DNA helicase PcrA
MTVRISEKHRAVLEAAGHCLVLGGPGSGKTTLALMKAVHRIDQKLRPGQTVLFLSFSRAAVARVADAVKDQVPADKRSSIGIQTFHSFFWEILRTHGHLLGAPKQLSIILAHDEKAMREGIERGEPGWNEWEQTRLRLFREEGRVCFDLFAPLTAEIFSRARRIRERVASRYPLILVDEAQDTGNEQWACAKALAEKSQLVCLADLDQLIFDHLPGVGPERVDQIRTALKPLEIDLGEENNRSPGTEIATFARDILHGRVRGKPYQNVSRHRFSPKADGRDKAIRQSVGIIFKTIREETGAPPESVALIASYGSGVAILSAALRKEPPINHQVLFDEAFVMLASRVGAFLLEPKIAARRLEDTAIFLELLAEAHRAKGGKTALEFSKKLRMWAIKTRAAGPPNVKLVMAIGALLQSAADVKHSGDPKKDWIRVKRDLRSSGNTYLSDVASALDYLVAFNRGHRIASSLSELWLGDQSYAGARIALDNALAQEQLLSGNDHLQGIHVMNMHKCKGKQFDGVILYRAQHCSPFVWPSDPPPHRKSRKVLHVAITRARKHVLMLDEISSACPIIDPHVL